MDQRVKPAATSGWQLENIVGELRAARSEWRAQHGRPREPGGRELPSRK
ncbi:MAG TPA: serine acetyltransferase, partial [Pseudomonas sp.]|nr:serine acetyltransferase [Pseudomonas sp.]